MPRPPREPLTPEQLKLLHTLAGVGLKTQHIAAAFGMSLRTFYRALQVTPGGSGTLKKGRADALSNVARTAYTLATSGKCPAMTMFYLKCRGGWREKDRVEVTGKNGGPVRTTIEDLVCAAGQAGGKEGKKK